MGKIWILLSVVGLSVACTEELFEPNVSEEKVVLVAPGNDVQLTDLNVSFFWENNPAIKKYRLQVATPNFSSPKKVVLDTLVEGNTFDVALVENDYQWRVRAENSAFASPYVSYFFSIINNNDFYKNVVVLSSPEDNLTTKDTTQVLTWKSVTGAVSYGLQILNKDNTVVLDNKVVDTIYTHNFKEGTFTWKVRADNDIVTTAYSSRKITIDTSYVASSTRIAN